MQHTEAALLGERVAVALRWGVLFSMGLLLALEGGAEFSVYWLLGLGAIWNLSLALLLATGRRLRWQGLICLTVDAALALLLFYFSGTVLGPLVWVGLLPVVSAALVFRLAGGLTASLLTAAAFFGLASIDVGPEQIVAAMLVPAVAYLLVGVSFGFMSQQLYQLTKQESDLELIADVERRRRERERAAALAEITSALNSSLVFERVLEIALDLCNKLMAEAEDSFASLASCILLFEDDGLRTVAARRLAAGDVERRLSGKRGVLRDVVEKGKPRVIEGASKDPELQLITGLQSTQSVYVTPLRFGLDLFGVMIFGHNQGGFFDEGRRELLEIVARQVMVALQNAQLYEALNEEKERISGIQEQARHQLARNLHDGPTQSVAAIAMRVNLARRLLGRDPDAAAEELYKVEELARRTTKEIRHMLFTLRPQALESDGLVAALEDLVRQTLDSYEQQVELEADATAVARMDLGRQGVLFYIVAEAVTNARKHAEAETIMVRLQKAENDVVLVEVMDNGKGFDQQEAEAKRLANGSLGMLTMRERVELINGIMRVDSRLGKGTRVRIWAPLTEAAAERLRSA